MVEEKKNILRQNAGLYAYYLNIYAMIYFKIKLLLEFRKNKNFCYIIVNVHPGLR